MIIILRFNSDKAALGRASDTVIKCQLSEELIEIDPTSIFNIENASAFYSMDALDVDMGPNEFKAINGKIQGFKDRSQRQKGDLVWYSGTGFKFFLKDAKESAEGVKVGSIINEEQISDIEHVQEGAKWGVYSACIKIGENTGTSEKSRLLENYDN